MPKNLKRYIGRGDLHFINFTRYERRALLGSVKARNLAVRILGEVRARYGLALLIIQVFKQRVSRQMRGRQRGRPGQLWLRFPEEARLRRFWQRRYFDFNVWTAEKVKEKLRYIHRNPVKRGLVAEPEDWPWSSFRHYLTGEESVVKIESQWTARKREQMGTTPRVKMTEPQTWGK